MKRVLVLCALVGVAVYATGAWSASSPSPTEQRLSKDVATLKSQVKALQSQAKTLKTDVGATQIALGETILLSVCSDEIAADALQGTWQVVDQVSAALQAGKTYFGPQTPVAATVGGQDICAGAFNVPRSQVLPPTIAAYQALLAQFHSNSFKVFTDLLRLHHK
jgi:hypothetical protein